MGIKNKEISQVRKRIEESIAQAEEERKRKLLGLRLEQARVGITAFKNRRLGEAARAFQLYLRTLEEIKGVPEGGLTPAHFDLKKEQQELLMISGIYWDLVKLYDRTRSPQRRRDFEHYFEKYLLFSKGMPFQALSAESLRKYISSDKPIHRGDFSNAYRVISVSKCFIASALIDVISPEAFRDLQDFRDQTLLRSRIGRLLVEWYYDQGPFLAEKVSQLPEPIRRFLGLALNCFARLVKGLVNIPKGTI